MEAGEIRCPNYAYERVFLHMFPGLALGDLGFTAREQVRGGARCRPREQAHERAHEQALNTRAFGFAATTHTDTDSDEESDVLRRAFMTSGTATAAAASWG